jgi:hypothetical protein
VPVCLDADVSAGVPVCPPTRLGAATNTIGTLLNAAAIAASIVVFSEWLHPVHLQANTKLKDEKRITLAALSIGLKKAASSQSSLIPTNSTFNSTFKLARDPDEAYAAAATSVAPIAVSILQSPFAHGSGLLFLSEPVGVKTFLRSQSSKLNFDAEDPSDNALRGALAPKKVPSGENVVAIPLPRSRPLIHQYSQERQIQIDSTRSHVADSTSNSAASASALSTSMAFLKKFFHFGQAANTPILPSAADGRTAVYDIEDHVIYLPNGKKLEAHSGLGKWLDDARYVNVKGRGPTPPNVYHLALRENLFHGVRAIRLNPVKGSNMFGRAGMLAHPYMLGPNGQSNGCVSVRNYPEFLEAYMKGDINRLIVVGHLEEASSVTANARAGEDRRLALQ